MSEIGMAFTELESRRCKHHTTQHHADSYLPRSTSRALQMRVCCTTDCSTQWVRVIDSKPSYAPSTTKTDLQDCTFFAFFISIVHPQQPKFISPAPHKRNLYECRKYYSRTSAYKAITYHSGHVTPLHSFNCDAKNIHSSIEVCFEI